MALTLQRRTNPTSLCPLHSSVCWRTYVCKCILSIPWRDAVPDIPGRATTRPLPGKEQDGGDVDALLSLIEAETLTCHTASSSPGWQPFLCTCESSGEASAAFESGKRRVSGAARLLWDVMTGDKPVREFSSD
ncbi:unnamed protein product [Pleuronectes platessa]|uniref:Uncharacterized protein n=1 Tax=Pleuronectes platessa TaxID=8262 RepID=A0A9N7YKE5_PLEPL|nr:unnamed protein product [Pleuronectes platessa]